MMIALDKLHINIWRAALFLLLSLVAIASSQAVTLTLEQQQMLQSLTPAQRSALLSQFANGQLNTTTSLPSQQSVTSIPSTTPAPIDLRDNTRLQSDGQLRILGDDTILLTVSSTDKNNNGDMLNLAPDSVQNLIGKSVQKLDQNGVLNLHGLPAIPLLGLNASEIEARLTAEPAFTGFTINVQILPLEPYDVRALKPFGYDFFNASRLDISPAADMPIPTNYPIGPGDIVNVQLFGKENASFSLQVNRDGQLDFPELGPITVSGLTYAQLKRRLQARVGRQMIGITPSISMGQLRSIQIFIAGEVEHPGSFTVSALTTVTNALLASGGIKETGSLRNVEVKRNNKTIAKVDLYDLLLEGNAGKEMHLQQGDVIFIPPVGTTVSVVGEVKRPAIYELKKETSVAQAVALAGGELPTSYAEHTKLERITGLGEHTVLDVDLSKAGDANTSLQNGDIVRVPSVLEESADIVTLAGYLYRPGIYQWHKGMRVSDIVGSINQLRPRPDVDYALLVREEGEERTIHTIDINPGKIFTAPKSAADLVLMPHDKLYFFGMNDSRRDAIAPIIKQLQQQASARNPERIVSIGGEVRFPGDYPLTDTMHVSDLLRAAGGLNQSAYELEAEVIHQVVKDEQRQVERSVVNLAEIDKGNENDPLLMPFDSLNIRQIPQWREKEVVQLFGEVRFPGKYIIGQGETLSSVIQRAGGLTKYAYPRGAVFTREELRKKEQENIDQLKDRLKQDIAAISLEQIQNDPMKAQSLSMSNSLLAQLDTAKAAGRLVIDLPEIIDNDKDSDVVLKDGDKLYIPKRPEEVTVIGEVNFPTSHFYDKGLSRDDYIQRSGGLTYKADENRIYVVRANGEVEATKVRWYWFNGKPSIEAGDVIVVPLDAERIRPLTLWTSISQIFYQIGVAAAAWKTIGVF